VLRYLAIDDSKIEPSRQVAANTDNQAKSNPNPPAVTQPSSEQQPQSNAQDKQRLEQADRQQSQAQPSSDAQNQKQGTIIEVALGILVLLCAAVMAVFLRKNRQAVGSA
jgi:hypothetical protein